VKPIEVRQKLGLSIAEMAQSMDLHRQTWTKWERGERQPDRAARRLMALLCWLHDNNPVVLANALSDIQPR